METSLLGKECVILLTKTPPRSGNVHAARRPGRVVGVWNTRHSQSSYVMVLVMLHSDGTLEAWETSEIALIESDK